MKIENNNHIMYCLNIYKGESWTDNFKAIKGNVLAVKKKFCSGIPFAVGLRISANAAVTLLKNISVFCRFLSDNGLYAVTINGFPYGSFHGTVIKRKVYEPDWSRKSRVLYTKNLIDILAALLPEGESGTISTVPSHYGKKENPACNGNLIGIATYLSEVEYKTGKRIILSLEPEPDCYLDSLDSTVEFFKGFDHMRDFKKYVGICLDCCHAAVEFETPLVWYKTLKANAIEVVKIQVSSALKAKIKTIEQAKKLFAPFSDKEYLHQVRIKNPDGIHRFDDLPAALSGFAPGEWRVHFHVPVTWKGSRLDSTVKTIEKDFFGKMVSEGNKHLELETYTYWVLPGTKLSIEDSILSELHWLKKKLRKIK
jgi:hypothetical protein